MPGAVVVQPGAVVAAFATTFLRDNAAVYRGCKHRNHGTRPRNPKSR